MNQIKIHSILSHPSIPKFTVFCPTSFGGKLNLIMMIELIINGSIEQIFDKINKKDDDCY